MFVIEVIPLKRGIGIESLSYYSALSYKAGTIISIPLRNQETMAVVIEFKPVSAAKTALKTATFSLRKLKAQPDARTLPLSIIKTAQKLSLQNPASLGAILFSLLPPEIRNGERMYPKAESKINTEDTIPKILTAISSHRYTEYKSCIRQTFAHRGSVIFVVPTSIEVEHAKKKLESGIENRVVTFSSTHTKKQLNASYEAFEDYRQAKLFIVTPAYSFLDRHDITAIIIEGAGSQNYIMRSRPYLDTKDVLKIFAKETGRSILLADAVPKTEDEIKRQDDIYTTYTEHTIRLELQGSVTLARHKKLEEGEAFSLCTSELREAVSRVLSNRGHAFLYAARRGLAPAIACYDCGHVFRCPDSGAPYSLLRTFKEGVEERWFVSHTSGKRVRAADVCTHCGGWRLREQGIGIQQVHDEVRKVFPKIQIFLFDHQTATTNAKAKKIIADFYASKKGILIGTNMVLPYLQKPVDISAVMSYEATRTVPTWRADETIFSLLITLRELTLKDLIVQLRTEEDELLQFASKGLIDQFYANEIEVRKALLYPPYATFVLLSFKGTKEQTEEIEEMLAHVLQGNEIQFYSAPLSNKNETLRYGLLRIEASKWPKADLVERLRSLPPYIKIEVNPDRIV